MDKLFILATVGSMLWFSVFYFFICMKFHRRWLAKKMDSQWLENNTRKTKRSTSELIVYMEKAIQRIRIMLKISLGFIILGSIHFLLDFFLNMPPDTIVFCGLILVGECIPLWMTLALLITTVDDRRKRIIEVMKETRSGQQSSLSEAGERNRTEMKDI